MAKKTFENDDNLPALPLPSLKNTLDLYLQSVVPFLTTNELEKTKRIVEEFGDNEGQNLQEKLLQRANENKNWLEEWWLKYAYLQSRDSLIFSTNFSGHWINHSNLHLTLKGTEEHKRSTSMARLLHQLLQFWLLLRHQKVPPFQDSQGKKFTMHQFRNFFNTTRIPKKCQDELIMKFKTVQEGGQVPDHVIVLYQGQFFKMSPIVQDQLCHPGAIIEAFKVIENNVDAKSSIGSISCQDRDLWSTHYALLEKANPETMKDINEAICMVILSDFEPENDAEQLKQCLVHDFANVWADKSLTFTAFKNGLITSQSEHSPFDGMVSAEVCGFCLHGLMKMDKTEDDTNHETIKVQALDLVIPKETLEIIPECEAKLKARGDDLLLEYHHFAMYGKTRLKQLKMHPDAFVQVMIQAAVYKTHSKCLATYETATTRQFYHGRTETVRSCTSEALAFAQAITDDKTMTSVKETQGLLGQAITKHLQLMEQCKNNQGCDRHLLGLKIQALEQGQVLPELFRDPVYQLSGGDGNFVMSTSLCGYSEVTGACPPMTYDGYGVFYGIPNDKICVWISSFKGSKFTQPTKLHENLFDILEKTNSLFE